MMLSESTRSEEETTMPIRPVVPHSIACPRCELAIPAACRRCKRPYSFLRRIADLEKSVEAERAQVESLKAANANLRKKVPVQPQLFPAKLPTAEEWEALLIAEAIKRTGNFTAAATAIGIGKTTIYRKLKGAPQ
jgi:DNA-binding NtrC family response regulator